MSSKSQSLGSPHSYEAEVAVIGAVLSAPSCVIDHTDKLVPEYFFIESHRIVAEAAVELLLENIPPDIINVHERLKYKGLEQAVGELDGLRHFLPYASHPENVESWLREVKKYWELRLLVEKCSDLAGRGRKIAGANIEQFLSEAEQVFMQLSEARSSGGLRPASEIVREAMLELEALLQTPGNVTGIPSGFTDLDKHTAGWQKSNLIVLAARPAMGKTALALNFATFAAIHNKKRVAFFSLEMGRVELMQRILATASRIHSQRFRDGKMSPDELHRLYPEARNLQTDNLMIDDTSGLSIGELTSRCRKIKREKGNLDLVIIDYLQLMTAGAHMAKQTSREREVAIISSGLKGLAKELACPVIALAQVNRALEARPDKRPKVSDLRESGSIEADADIIMTVYRDEVYNKDSPEKGIAEVIIGKNRHGATDTVKLAFQSEFTSFHNLATYHQ